MIYITGDTHADFRRFTKRSLKDSIGEDDIVIICGDFGLLWSRDNEFQYWCDFFATRKYQTLWIAGNHDNYDMIQEYLVETWNGGKIRRIAGDKCIYLERGQVFNIKGKKFFTFGGAASHDIQGGVLDRSDPDFATKVKRLDREMICYRILKETWWPQELPTEDEMQEGLDNLAASDNKVDYIITHCASSSMQKRIACGGPGYDPDRLTDYFEKLEDIVEYKKWIFGHYHEDAKIGDKHHLLYEDIISIDEA